MRLRARPTSGGRAAPYVPGVQGVGVVERSATLPGGHAGLRSRRPPAWRPATAASPSGALVPDDDVVPLAADVADAAAGGPRACPPSPRGWRSPARPAAAGRARAGARRRRRGRARSRRRGQVLGAGRVVAVCRSAEAAAAGAAAGCGRRRPARRRRRRPHRPAPGRRAAARVDVVVDPVFGVAATAASRVLATAAGWSTSAAPSGDVAEFSSAVLRSRTADVLGYTNNALTPDQRREALDRGGPARRGRAAGRRPRGAPAGRGRGRLAAAGHRRRRRAAGAHPLTHPDRPAPAAPDPPGGPRAAGHRGQHHRARRRAVGAPRATRGWPS